MVTDVNAVGRMSQCSVSNLKRGMHFRSFIYIYWHANTDLDFFFKRGVCIDKKIAEKNRIVDIHVVNVYEHEN